MNKYDDIINLPHYVSKTRPKMSKKERAAQFSPYSALTGYRAAIKETETKLNVSESDTKNQSDSDNFPFTDKKFPVFIGQKNKFKGL